MGRLFSFSRAGAGGQKGSPGDDGFQLHTPQSWTSPDALAQAFLQGFRRFRFDRQIGQPPAEVTCIAQPFAQILHADDFIPQPVPASLLAAMRESQEAKVARLVLLSSLHWEVLLHEHECDAASPRHLRLPMLR